MHWNQSGLESGSEVMCTRDLQAHCVDCSDETNILNNFLSVLMLVWQFDCHCGCYLHGTIVINMEMLM